MTDKIDPAKEHPTDDWDSPWARDPETEPRLDLRSSPDLVQDQASIQAPEASGRKTGWVFYDGQCRTCTRLAHRIAPYLNPHGFRLAPLQSQEAKQTLGLDSALLLNQMWLVSPDGQVFGGAEAIAHLAQWVGWLWPLRVLAAIPGGMAVMRAIYRSIASNRQCLDGRCAMKRPSPWLGLAPLFVLPAAVATLTSMLATPLAPWIMMWLMAAAVFCGCKWLSWWNAPMRSLASTGRSLAYLFAWPGMDAESFLSSAGDLDTHRAGNDARITAPSINRWAFTFTKIAVGIVALYGVARLIPETQTLWAGWIGLMGLALILHFGLFELLAHGWQRAGVNAQPIMDKPLAAVSISGFWGRRWNRAFQQLAFKHVFGPLHRRIGVSTSTFLVFAVSGLIHELVISVPARGGFGLPTAYFLLQWLGLTIERSALGKKLGLGRPGQGKSGRPGKSVRGWLFTAAFVAGPAFWLFHPLFIQRVMIPFMHAIGALSKGDWSWPC